MAYPSSQLDAAKNPQTRCSNCQTVFEVSRELLSSSDTRVRCGECLSIFDALEEIRTPDSNDNQPGIDAGSSVHTQHVVPASNIASSGDAALAGLNNQTSSLDVTYSDFDLFSEEADLPEIAYFDQTRDTPDFDFDSVEMTNDETFNDTLFVHDVTIDADATTARRKPVHKPEAQESYADIDFVSDEQPREPLIFNYRDAPVGAGKANSAEHSEPATASARTATETETNSVASRTDTFSSRSEASQSASKTAEAEAASATAYDREDSLEDFSKPKRSNPWIFRLAMFALLGVLLGSLFAYRTRPQLYNNPSVRPVLEAGCNLLGCELPARVELKSLKMVKRNVYSHPNTPNALVINVSFRNDADFAQQLPVLHMVLSNRVGRTVARQDFTPPDYLPGWKEGASIASGQQLDVTLEVTDPGQDAQSFEFYFREFKS